MVEKFGKPNVIPFGEGKDTYDEIASDLIEEIETHIETHPELDIDDEDVQEFVEKLLTEVDRAETLRRILESSERHPSFDEMTRSEIMGYMAACVAYKQLPTSEKKSG